MESSSVLIQKFNPITGKTEWELQKENYDYTQEVARAGFADMLHDEERNLKYNLALQKAILSLRDKGEKVHVLDIGTGTGLLAMMGANANADLVTACETFQPMVTCATEVMKHNGFWDKINLIPKRSTDIQVGPDKDMSSRANILVTEVFDTELIGEGAIGTYNHANRELLSENSITVPARGTIYAQLIECSLALHWNRLQPVQCGEKILQPPPSVKNCPGNGAVHDIQLAQLALKDFTMLSEPVAVFHFDWNSKVLIPQDDHKTVKLNALAAGTVHAVLMWWTLDMDQEGEIILSCAPPWNHPEGSQLPWRDHWMQAVYYLPSDITIESAGQPLSLTGYHDEYSLWFELDLGHRDSSTSTKLSRPFCTCSIHMAVSRTRLAQLNDPLRNQKYQDVLKLLVQPSTVCLTKSDCSLMALIVAQLGARKVYAVESNPHWRRVLDAMIKVNNLEHQVVVFDGNSFKVDSFDSKVDLILGEPVFQSSVLPWHNLYFGQWWKSLKQEHLLLMADSVTVVPGQAHIYAMAIDLKDLWKIRAPIGTTQGLNLKHFDQLMEEAIDLSDELVEPHPLWEYPCRSLSEPFKIMTLNLEQSVAEQATDHEGHLLIDVDGSLNGVAIWMDWQLDSVTTVSGGPTSQVRLGHQVSWDRHIKQGVYFIKKPVTCSTSSPVVLLYRVHIQPHTMEVKFDFSLE